jgi:hypothetical protein
MWKKIRQKIRQLLCSHYGPMGGPVVHGYSFYVNEKKCHVCGALVRQRTNLDVVKRNLIPFDERLIEKDRM